tara:strand:- start:278 stop:445 length:168 start_codon:yes stop_codon:yes gene_type:complete
MIGSLFVLNSTGEIWVCVKVEHAHIAYITLVSFTGKKWECRGLRELDKWFKPLET